MSSTTEVDTSLELVILVKKDCHQIMTGGDEQVNVKIGKRIFLDVYWIHTLKHVSVHYMYPFQLIMYYFGPADQINIHVKI